uniref:Cilia- and flagella-associated protein 97 n=1 Tax=Ixodes ricinus TaxID=34613 RepID=A0A131XX65_IXORI
MSWKVGLGDNHDDLDLQGEVDVAFFDSAPTYPGDRTDLKSAPVDLGGRGQSCHLASADLYPAQPIAIPSLPMDSYRLPPTLNSGFFGTLHQQCGASSSAPTNSTLSTDRDMKDAPSPPHRSMDDDELGLTSPRTSITDSDGLSSLSEGSMEGLSESESITDVTPLHSPYMCDSPIPTRKLPRSKLTLPESILLSNGCARAEDTSSGSDSDNSGSFAGTRRKTSVKLASGKVRLGAANKHRQQSDAVDLQLLVDAIRRLEAHQCEQGHSSRTRKSGGGGDEGQSSSTTSSSSLAKNRKNMSFSNEEVQRIDRENQRLLKRILAQQNRPRPKFDARSQSRLAPSAINRQRQQRQIEVENLALFKRIESAKPSREVTSSQECAGHIQRSRSHSLSLTRHNLPPSSAVLAGPSVPPLGGVTKHFPPRQKHHSH